MENKSNPHSEKSGGFLVGRVIKLTRGYETIVDDEDFEYLNQFKWHSLVTPSNVYASNYTKGLMHRHIMNPSPEVDIDHKDCNGLNNRKSNLRPATRMQNLRNSRIKTKTSIFKGVCFDKDHKKWRGQITIEKKQMRLGWFNNEKDAALAYDLKAIEFFGEFARINFPKGYWQV